VSRKFLWRVANDRNRKGTTSEAAEKLQPRLRFERARLQPRRDNPYITAATGRARLQSSQLALEKRPGFSP
jgi:hypothetical protein